MRSTRDSRNLGAVDDPVPQIVVDRDPAHLDYMHARYPSPHLGRFLSPDPVLARPGVPQASNLYAYVRNNPVNLVDPSGLFGASFFFLFSGLPVAESSREVRVARDLVAWPLTPRAGSTS